MQVATKSSSLFSLHAGPTSSTGTRRVSGLFLQSHRCHKMTEIMSVVVCLPTGFTPLILAATAGHVGVVEILLDKGGDIEAQSERTKDTPLSLACSGGRQEVKNIPPSLSVKTKAVCVCSVCFRFGIFFNAPVKTAFVLKVNSCLHHCRWWSCCCSVGLIRSTVMCLTTPPSAWRHQGATSTSSRSSSTLVPRSTPGQNIYSKFA